MHGSPVYKAAIPTFFSTGFLILLAYADTALDNEKSVQHPYTIGAFIAFFSFLLTFRLNFAYQRYWEGATAVHQMLSKWLDVAMTLAAWHYQAASYDDIKPPAFGNNPLATPDAMPDRPHALERTMQDTIDSISEASAKQYTSWYDRFKFRKLNELEKQQRAYKRQASKEAEFSLRSANSVKFINSPKSNDAIPVPSRFRDIDIYPVKSGRPPLMKQPRGSLRLTRTRPAHTPAPSLFLQELAHLSSLLSAVAMSTLRNDIEMAESPLTEYIPGQPWPPVSTIE